MLSQLAQRRIEAGILLADRADRLEGTTFEGENSGSLA